MSSRSGPDPGLSPGDLVAGCGPDRRPGCGTVTLVTTAGSPASPTRRHCRTPDGLGIAAYDFGGEGPDLLLVHATGFCAEPFGPLAASLARAFRCWGLDLRGHGHSDRPANDDFGWSGFATDVLTVVDQLGLDHPYGFGHSCGGATVLLAEQTRPGLFQALYCFEPVVMPDAVRDRMAGRNPLAESALRRRETFPSAEEAQANYASKPPYADPRQQERGRRGGQGPVRHRPDRHRRRHGRDRRPATRSSSSPTATPMPTDSIGTLYHSEHGGHHQELPETSMVHRTGGLLCYARKWKRKLAESASRQIPLNPEVKANLPPSAASPPPTVKAMAVDFAAAAEKWDAGQRILLKVSRRTR